MNSLSSTSSEDAVLAGLLDYCSDHGIQTSPRISVRRVPGKGLGVYTRQPLRPGERVMHVPTAALFTTASVPLSFVGKEARKSIPVHALLAAYLAFGMSEAKREEHARWMATWPRLTDFTSTMPLFWPERLKTNTQTGSVVQDRNTDNKTEAEAEAESEEKKVFRSIFLPFPPSLTGAWLPSSPRGEETMASKSKPLQLLDVQQAKFESHVQILAQAFPSRAAALLSPSDPLHWKLVHMWCIVSSRCFYYLRPGQPAPKDSNEAMALCPTMDLFNHADAPRCHTTYDRKGYYVTTAQEHGADEEVFLGYGAHSNDVLWTEYGFLMDSNASDGVQLDQVILPSLTDAQKQTLQDAGYLGDYWLKPDGLCWRTEAVSWLGILTPGQWHRFLEGRYDPAGADGQFASIHLGDQDEEQQVDRANRKRKRAPSSSNAKTAPANPNPYSPPNQSPSERAKRRQLAWLTSIVDVAEHSLKELMSMVGRRIEHGGKAEDSREELLLEWFGDEDTVLQSQGLQGSEVPEMKSSQARLRHKMCTERWRQIWNLCTTAIVAIRDGCPTLRDDTARMAAGNPAQPIQGLETLVDEFLRQAT